MGPYPLVRRLGSGGMGRVFLGLSPGRRLVAVKVIHPELAADPEFRERFRREVAAARKVSGAFTAPVVDADTEGEVPWLATAYLHGPSLAEVVARDGPLPAHSVLDLAAGLAEGVRAIHAAGVVHRDLKPSNVVMAEDGPRIIDFGISRAGEATSLTGAGAVIGTAEFMSPEQAERGEVGPPSDIWSLGAVLAFAATAQEPFGTGSAAEVLYRVVHGSPNLDRVPAEVRPLLEHCLIKDPGQRPTAADLLAQVGMVPPAPVYTPTVKDRPTAKAPHRPHLGPPEHPRTVTGFQRVGRHRLESRKGARPRIRLIITSVAAAAVLTAAIGFALMYQQAHAQALDWGDMAIPGQMCQVSGQIQLHDGAAKLSHSGLGPLFVQLGAVTHGFLARDFPVAALNILCSNRGGTQLADGIFVFTTAGQPRFLGLLTPQYREPQAPLMPLIAVEHIDTQGHIATVEYFYLPGNADCCPTGRATSIWKWTGSTFRPGRTKITSG